MEDVKKSPRQLLKDKAIKSHDSQGISGQLLTEAIQAYSGFKVVDVCLDETGPLGQNSAELQGQQG
jgi:hypothetical protein